MDTFWKKYFDTVRKLSLTDKNSMTISYMNNFLFLCREVYTKDLKIFFTSRNICWITWNFVFFSKFIL